MQIRRLKTRYGQVKRQVLMFDEWYDLPEDNKQALNIMSNIRLSKGAPLITEFICSHLASVTR